MREEILKRITENKNMTKVNLEALRIDNNEIIEIIEMIQALKPNVSKIDLDNNNISDEGASILSEHLREFHNLTELSVQFNAIGREGAMDLFGLKKVFSGLDILFHGNKIFDVGEMDEIERLAVGSDMNHL